MATTDEQGTGDDVDTERPNEDREKPEPPPGAAWQAKEMEQAGRLAEGGRARRDAMSELVSEAFSGQDVDTILGEPPFEAATASILDQPLLVVHQPRKMIAVSDTYVYSLPDGTELGRGEQTNQGPARKLLRMATNLDSRLKTVVDVTQDEERLFSMERKGKIGKNTLVIRDSSDAEVGRIRQTKRDRRARFALEVDGETIATADVGRLHPGSGFDIVAADGEVVAFVRRLHEGVFKAVRRWAMDSPDNYVLRLAKPLVDPLRTLVVATPMSVDSAVNQDDEGLDVGKVLRRLR